MARGDQLKKLQLACSKNFNAQAAGETILDYLRSVDVASMLDHIETLPRPSLAVNSLSPRRRANPAQNYGPLTPEECAPLTIYKGLSGEGALFKTYGVDGQGHLVIKHSTVAPASIIKEAKTSATQQKPISTAYALALSDISERATYIARAKKSLAPSA